LRFGLLIFLALLLSAPLSAEEGRLKIETVRQGMGPPIELGEVAVVAHKLTVGDDVLVEKSSVRNPFPFQYGAKNIIPGLNQGIEGMKTGEKRYLEIPPHLGYGSKDMGLIPADSTLFFEIELLEIREQLEESEDSSDPTDMGEDLHLRFQDKDVLNKRHAQDITKPAMFEYLIRDFFTKPWRYEDGHLVVWRSVGKMFIALILLFTLALWGRKKGYWSL